MQRFIALLAFALLLGMSCGPVTKDQATSRDKAVKVVKGNAKSPQLEVHYKFNDKTTIVKDAKLIVVCIVSEMVNADISFQVNEDPWQLIKGVIPAMETQVRQDKKIFIVKHVWQMPDITDQELKLKVEVTSSDGRKTAHEIKVDYTIPVSKVTFDPFSLGKE